MKKFSVICFLVILVSMLGGTTASALQLYENYIIDEVSGLEWYRDLSDFIGLTYNDQLTAIQNSDTAGGGWRMANADEFETLLSDREFSDLFWDHKQFDDYIFEPTNRQYNSEKQNWLEWIGRLDIIEGTYAHGGYYSTHTMSIGSGHIDYSEFQIIMDSTTTPLLGAWAVRSATGSGGDPVPEPATWLMITIGFSAMILVRRTRKR